MLKKEWYCNICNTDINYTLAGKHCHLKTPKHNKINVKFKRIQKHLKNY